MDRSPARRFRKPQIVATEGFTMMLGHNRRKMSGAECMADMLRDYGVTHVFHVPAVLRKTFAVMESRTDIKRLHVHGEKSAAYMADGYARASGKPGVCMAQVIGALNLAAGLRDAWLAHSPVIAMTGGRDPKTKFRKVYQEVDDVPAFEPVTKFNATIDDVARFPDMVRQAFRVATSGTPGPVHLQFRGNEGQLDGEEAEMEPLVETQFARVPAFRPEPERASLLAALAALQQAERPVIIAGGGVRASAAGAELVALAEALQIPVATSLNGKDSIPGTHPLSVGVVGTYSRESANRVVNRADLVCFVGTETGGMTTHFWAVPPIGVPAIQIDIDPEALGRNYPLQAGVNGDAKVALARMLEHVDRAGHAKRKAWIAEVQSLCKAWYAKYESVLSSDAVPIRPERICAEITRHTPEDAIVVVDTGHAGMWMGGMYDLTSPNQSYLRSAGHLGWAFPAGLGAKCACPNRPVLVFTGDAGFWYHIGEIETAARWNINSVTVVNNNSSGNQSKRGFDRAYGGSQTEQARELWTYTKVNFARIAQDMGAVGIRVEQPAELGPAIDKALKADRPVVVDVVTDIEVLAPAAVT
jgi:acetolactate synthase I/II/III large subunit